MRRRARRYSVDADIHDFRQLRKALKQPHDRFFDIATEEHSARGIIDREEQRLFQATMKQFHEKLQRLRYIQEQNFLAELRDQCGHNRMRQLIAHSKEVSRQKKLEAERERKAQQEEEIAKYRRKMDKVRENWQRTKKEIQRNQRLHTYEERVERRQRMNEQHERDAAQRSKSVMELRALEAQHRDERIIGTVNERLQRRQQVAAYKKSVVSPSAFLQLPSLKDMLKNDDNELIRRTTRKAHSIAVGGDDDVALPYDDDEDEQAQY